MIDIYVSKNRKSTQGSYRTVNEALSHIADNAEPATVHIAPGIYEEQITVRRPYVTFEGADWERTVLTSGLGALEILGDGIKRGTFRTQTLFVDTHDFTARDLTVRNTAGSGRIAGQAIALYADGDRLEFDHCCITGRQDTLFTGPLPPRAYEPGGFRGPKEFAPRINGRQYYHDCFICGDIDFIFGSATAYFDGCEIYCRKSDTEDPAVISGLQKTYSYITAASTPEGQEYGYVFNRCRLTGDCPENSCYLGRPWRNYARVVFINCEMGSHIKPEGWDDWKKADAHATVFFGEYNSKGPGASDRRAPFSVMLDSDTAASFTRQKVLGF